MSLINDKAAASIKTEEKSTEEKAESTTKETSSESMPTMPGAGAGFPENPFEDPSMSQIPQPTLIAIIEELKSGGRRAVMRYLNDREVVKKLGVAMHLTEGRTVTALKGIRGTDMVHQLASVVDTMMPMDVEDIAEDIDGGPRSAKRYWNDREVLKKLCVAIYLVVAEDRTAKALDGIPGAIIVQQTASVVDFEAGADERFPFMGRLPKTLMKCAQVRLDAGTKVDALDKNKITTLHYGREKDNRAALGRPREQNVAAFADAVVEIYLKNAGDLDLIAEEINSSKLEFREHGDTFFEVVFAGGRIQPGTMKPDEQERHTYSILECEAKSEVLLSSVIYIMKILRQKRFLTKNFNNIMQKFLGSLAYFEDNERFKLAIFTALSFSQKLPLLPESVFQPLLENNLVEKGFSLRFISDLFKEYLNRNNFNSLISIWKRGKVEDSFHFIRSGVRSAEDLSTRLFIAGMEDLVDFFEKMNMEKIKAALTTRISDFRFVINKKENTIQISVKNIPLLTETEKQHAISVLIQSARQHAEDTQVPEKYLVGILMEVLTRDSDRWREDVNQYECYVYSQVKTQWELLKALCTTEVLQEELMNILQQYPPSLFSKLVRWLISKSVISDCVILDWSYDGETQIEDLKSLKYVVMQLQCEDRQRVLMDHQYAVENYKWHKRQDPSYSDEPPHTLFGHRSNRESYEHRVHRSNQSIFPGHVGFDHF